jgi:hypothetical protein
MNNIYLFIFLSLIFLVISGIFGLFFLSDKVKKISCLSISYSSFVAIMILLSLKNSEILNNILTILVSIIIVFTANLLIGIAILKKEL